MRLKSYFATGLPYSTFSVLDVITAPVLSVAVSSRVYTPAGRSNISQLPVQSVKPPSSDFLLPVEVFRTFPPASTSLPSSLATEASMVGDTQTVPYSQL